MSTIHLGAIRLNGAGWPGAVNPNRSIPTDGWDNTVDNITTTSASETPPVPVGTKVMAYSSNPEAPGYYVMQYLMYACFSGTLGGTISPTDYSLGKAICSHIDYSTAEKYASDTSAVPYYVVGKCFTAASSDATKGQPLAIPCATLTCSSAAQAAGYGDSYGWFWIDGVCPLDDVSYFRGALDTSKGFDISVDTLMRGGPLMVCMTAAAPWLSSMDATNYGDSTAFTNALHAVGVPVAWACTSCV